MDNKQITVTSPLLPNLDEFHEFLKEIWDSKWITNNGSFHRQLETALAEYLKVPFVSLFTNGTLPLLTALQALRITGEVITTPYSFVATTHSIWWNGCKPVFVDIDPKTGNMDPDKIESAITPRTSAIMPVHCYGKPCDVRRIKEISDKYGLKVIYDAAHAFALEIPKNEADYKVAFDEANNVFNPSKASKKVEVETESILKWGDMSTLSFHATKVYNTIEGGAMIMHDAETKKRIDYLKNFGFADEVTVVGPGINSKVDEMRAAYGLLNLKQVDSAIEARKNTA
ncbi:MAG: DegT/DnrJ/EryC1/StrS family aminotransferase, partial [Clostridium sp.]|nr:DegT/DnrJ/EryC1/StrS family aminotransferase [Clostridium sp.]